MREVIDIGHVRKLIEESSGVIFDNDGTLVNSMPCHLRAWQLATTAHGLDFTEKQFYDFAGAPALEIIETLSKQQGKSADPAKVMQAKQEALNAEIQAIEPISVVFEFVEYAKSLSKPVAVASGGQRKDVIESLASCGINAEKHFQAIIAAEDVKMGKPHPETFLLAASRLGVDPRSCLGFEDAAKGLEALNRAGMKSIDVRNLPGYPLPEYLHGNKETS